ncbi:DUF3530 family protein [Marinobacter oulmenensis]|uniref:DUF3530 domain-containing protein n=1 Tax=Marinobacter oulmenensis TaxID=643747 RepID=A0A840U268_9GAMM|nr:hypothetical protein [Marinobacter oulmenensis]
MLSANLWAQAAENAEAPPEPAPTTGNGSMERSSVITGLGEWALARLYPDQAVWLSPNEDNRALALFQPELKTPTRGAVLVLADEGQTADEAVLGPLRQALAESGLATMTLGLNEPPEPLREAREERNVPTPEGEEESTQAVAGNQAAINVAQSNNLEGLASEYRTAVSAALDAAAAELAARGYQRVYLIGVGWSADYVTQWAAATGTPAGVIWLAPRFYPQQLAALPEQLAGERSWRLLDLHDTNGRADLRAQQRAGAFARQGVADYQRQPLPMASPPVAEDARWVANRVVTWVLRQAGSG